MLPRRAVAHESPHDRLIARQRGGARRSRASRRRRAGGRPLSIAPFRALVDDVRRVCCARLWPRMATRAARADDTRARPWVPRQRARARDPARRADRTSRRAVDALLRAPEDDDVRSRVLCGRVVSRASFCRGVVRGPECPRAVSEDSRQGPAFTKARRLDAATPATGQGDTFH